MSHGSTPIRALAVRHIRLDRSMNYDQCAAIRLRFGLESANWLDSWLQVIDAAHPSLIPEMTQCACELLYGVAPAQAPARGVYL